MCAHTDAHTRVHTEGHAKLSFKRPAGEAALVLTLPTCHESLTATASLVPLHRGHRLTACLSASPAQQHCHHHPSSDQRLQPGLCDHKTRVCTASLVCSRVCPWQGMGATFKFRVSRLRDSLLPPHCILQSSLFLHQVNRYHCCNQKQGPLERGAERERGADCQQSLIQAPSHRGLAGLVGGGQV